MVLGLHVRDLTAGFRAYAASAIAKIELDHVKADGYGFQIEMAYAVANNAGRIVEVPITFGKRVRGASKMSSIIVFEALGMVTWWASAIASCTATRCDPRPVSRRRSSRRPDRLTGMRDWLVAGALIEGPKVCCWSRTVVATGRSTGPRPAGSSTRARRCSPASAVRSSRRPAWS